MGCSRAPAPAPGHQARRASGGNRLGPLPPKAQGACGGPLKGLSRPDWLQGGAELLQRHTRSRKAFLHPAPFSKTH